MAEQPPPIWKFPPFWGEFADPYLEETDLEGGRMDLSLGVLDDTMAQMVNDKDAAGLSLFSDAQVQLVEELRTKLAECREIATAVLQVEQAGQLQQVVQEVAQRITNLAQADTMFIPAGWDDGRTSDAHVMIIVERTAADQFELVICNPGDVLLRPDTGRRENPGLEYHPTNVEQSPKIKYKTCMRLTEVRQDKLIDPVFLSMLFNQRTTQDEAHRAVVFYDVLLPWVLNKPVMQAFDNADPAADWSTPQRSRMSAYRSAVEGLRYWFRRKGLDKPRVKQFTFGIRLTMLNKVGADLEALVNPEGAATAVFKNLMDCELESVDGNRTLGSEALKDKVYGLYFGAPSWCPPCRSFDPKLKAFYNALQQAGQPFEVVFCSFDKTEAAFTQFRQHMPWLAIPYDKQLVLNELKEKFANSGIPKFVLINRNGEVLSLDGRAIVNQDPAGVNFPWRNAGEEEEGGPPADPVQLRASDARLIKIACEQTVHAALKENQAGRLDFEGLKAIDDKVSEVLWTRDSIPIVGGDEGGLPPAVQVDTECAMSLFTNNQQLVSTGEDDYRGARADPEVPTFADLLRLPESVSTIDEALAAMTTCKELCDELLHRANLRDSTASSQIVMQAQVIQLIGALFTCTMPMPKSIHSGMPDLWSTRVAQAKQLELLEMVHWAQQMYTNMWQDVEEPTRTYCSERAVVCLAMYTVFCAIIRVRATDNELAMTRLLLSGGGWCTSMGTGRKLGTQGVEEHSKSWELVTPVLAKARGAAVDYLMSVQQGCARQILNLRMNPNAELECDKTDATMQFIRQLVAQCGYELMPRSMPPGATEMHALMGWLGSEAGNGTFGVLSEEHPDWQMMRDMVCLWKFTTTMLTPAQEMMERRADTTTEDYHISFDQGSQRTSRNGRSTNLKWAVSRVRGNTNNIADFNIRGYGRKLNWGSDKSILVESPTDVVRYARKQCPTEDDILWLEDEHLKDFVAGALSCEEAERLLGYLTVEYVRIPLVTSFFGEGDRAALLFAESVQKLFSATLLEQGRWAPLDGKLVTRVPTRVQRNMAVQADRAIIAGIIDHDQQVLGTFNGLLLSEMQHSPQAVFTPLMETLKYIDEVSQCSVHSVNASFILFMIQVAANCESYLVHCLEAGGNPALAAAHAELSDFMQGTVLQVLLHWLEEAEEEETSDGKRKGNQNTMVVVHSYIALLLSNLTQAQMDVDKISQLLGSLAYVRTEHAYGTILRNLELNTVDNSTKIEELEIRMVDMSQEEQEDARREIEALEGENGNTDNSGVFSADQKRLERQVGLQLIKFLQAQGVNTEDLDEERLRPYLTGEPLWFCQGPKVLRIPLAGFTKRGKQFKPPPMEVPEYQLFSMTQRLRRPVVQWLQAHPAAVSDVMNKTVSVALHSHIGEMSGATQWVEVSRGVYHEPIMDIKIDVQAAEILSNDQETRPVPDSMTAFSDFEQVFGKEALRCSFKFRHEHRQWVSIVGEDHELLEWDSPDPTDQGVGGPKGLPGDDFPFYEGFLHRGIRYTRPFRYYLQEDQVPPPPPPLAAESWIVDILTPVLEAVFPSGPLQLDYALLMPEDELPADATECRLIGLADADTEAPCFKEFVVSRNYGIVHASNWISHGRRMFCKQIFSSNARFALHGMQPNGLTAHKPQPDCVRFGGGSVRERDVAHGAPTLVVTRFNHVIHGRETLVPHRLLQGVVPGSLLDACSFWQGEDLVIRGTPKSMRDEWYSYKVEVHILENGDTTIIRKDTTPFSEIESGQSSTQQRSILKRRNSNFVESNQSRPLERTASRSMARTKPLVDAVGCAADAADYALTCFVDAQGNENYDLAERWLSDPSNAAAVAALSGGNVPSGLQRAASHAGGVASHGTRWTRPENPAETLLLFNPLTAERGSVLWEVCQLLARVEDMSHCLVWTLAESCNADGLWQIYKIELPRLKLSFTPKRDSKGVVRLHSVEQSGWFVSQYAALTAENKLPVDRPGMVQLNDLLQGVPNCLILENKSQELQALVSSHKQVRPSKRGEPFTTQLVADRTDEVWLSTMADQRYFMMPVHTSCTFLTTPSMESLLYLLMLRFAARDYSRTFSLLEACCVDTTFNASEHFIYKMIEGLKDAHPNAHAIRLKLCIGLQYSENVMEGKTDIDLTREYDAYLKKLCHVSAGCRLTEDQEAAIWAMSKSGTALIKNRCAYVQSLHQNLPQAAMQHPRLMLGGSYWSEIEQIPTARVNFDDTGFSNYRYTKEEDQLGDEAILTMIFEEEMTKDDITGSVRQRGFLFLYELLTGKLPAQLNGQDVTKSLGELMFRLFFLRHSTWGRNARSVAEGTRHFTELAGIMAAPAGHNWPEIPDLAQLGEPEGLDILNFEDGNSAFANQFLTDLRREHHRVRSAVAHDALVAAKVTATTNEKALHQNLTARLALNVLPVTKAGCGFPEVQNTGCSERFLVPMDPLLSAAAIDAFGDVILSMDLDMDNFVQVDADPKQARTELPFDISSHPDAAQAVAANMLNRFQDDMQRNAQRVASKKKLWMNGLNKQDISGCVDGSPAPAVQATAKLDELIVILNQLQERDARCIDEAITTVIQLSNTVPESAPDAPGNQPQPQKKAGYGGVYTREQFTEFYGEADSQWWWDEAESAPDSAPLGESLQKLRFSMLRFCGRRADITPTFALGATLSTVATEDLLAVNPYCPDPKLVVDMCAVIVLYTSRLAHINRTLASAMGLRQQLSPYILGRPASDRADATNKLEAASARLAGSLLAKRYSVDHDTKLYDPRFLLFEFIFGFPLRRRQVEMVRDFLSCHARNDSSCQQMIMGAGKTSVIGPLLALCLTDGSQLLTMTCPPNLLEMTRGCLRSTFSSIVTKRIYTLEFDRAWNDDGDGAIRIKTLFQKLETARRTRGVLCSKPECLKSLMLKFIEMVHLIEKEDVASLALTNTGMTGGQSVGNQLHEMKAKMMGRSDTADAIVPIIRMWQQGVLIMDEVDVLLHPLKSELNFPIGEKDPIDMFGDRWELPIHMMNAVFGAQAELKQQHLLSMAGCDEAAINERFEALKLLRDQQYEGWVQAEARADTNLISLREQITHAVEAGIAHHKIQTIPHLVLLDSEFYSAEIRPLMAQWVLVYLHRNLTQDLSYSVSNADAWRYVQGAASASPTDYAEFVAVKRRIAEGAAGSAEVAREASNRTVSREPTPQAPPEPAGLACVHCTFVNQPGASTCELCGMNPQNGAAAASAAKVCAFCGWNDPTGGATECGLCYSPFPRVAAVSAPASRPPSRPAGAAPEAAQRSVIAGNTTIRLFDLKGNEYSLKVDSSSTASDIKSRIESAHGFPNSTLNLYALSNSSGEQGELINNSKVELWSHLYGVRFTVRIPAAAMKLLNLSSDWIQSFLPHCLSKINRVTYGLLGEYDRVPDLAPLSRIRMAVPFIGKDVPSRSSEFAHPDVLIGLTIMGYRYEGLRADAVGRHKADVERVMSQLKIDFASQIGTSAERPAAILFEGWKRLGFLSVDIDTNPGDIGVLPLAEFQAGDKDQLARVAKLIGSIPEVIHYYLEEHIFPDTMRFQSLKISACGHEMGGGILFGCRMGFSGTPSYLLPAELGECLPEPGSDGQIMDTLTSPEIMTFSLEARWNAKKLLNDIARDDHPHGPFHALIDTGALVTGMDNLEVAEYLLSKLNDSYQGVVYLDRNDQKMILLRSSRQSLKLSQSGVPWKNRFSFYDQVHTTGMDIKQFPNARAVVTIGKDMTFRDYAQGCFRMRGLESGHTLHLYIIPEVASRIREELGPMGLNPDAAGGSTWEICVAAWLLTNSMRMEGLQHMQLLIQELHNVWRGTALEMLLINSESNKERSPEMRLKRFVGNNQAVEMLCGAVQQFREIVDYVIPETVPEPEKFSEVVEKLVIEHGAFVSSPESKAKVAEIVSTCNVITKTSESKQLSSKDSEREQQQEKEQEQEKEKEKEREREREGQFTRDDEQHNSWYASKLLEQAKVGGQPGKDFTEWVVDQPFYPFHAWKLREYEASLPFPGCLLLSQNYFRPRWAGMHQDRRLKNIGLILEWVPDTDAPTERYLCALSLLEGETLRHVIHHQAMNGGPGGSGIEAAPAAAAANATVVCPVCTFVNEAAEFHCTMCTSALPRPGAAPAAAPVAVPSMNTLAERLMMGKTALALRTVHGIITDSTDNFVPEAPGGQIDASMQCLRFFDGQMYYDKDALDVLGKALIAAPLDVRQTFFDRCLMTHRRERTMWSDTPVAKLFTEESQWDDLRPAALIEAIKTKCISERLNSRDAFEKFDLDGDGNLSKSELRAMFSSLHLAFTAGDIASVMQKADSLGAQDSMIDYDEFTKLFNIPKPKDLIQSETEKYPYLVLPWWCMKATCGGSFENPSPYNGGYYCMRCSAKNPAVPDHMYIHMDQANMGGDGFHGANTHAGKWSCPQCTMLNEDRSHYCKIDGCNAARPW